METVDRRLRTTPCIIPLLPPCLILTHMHTDICMHIPQQQFYPKQYLYATPILVAGLLSGALLIAVAYLGAAVLLSLQVT